MEKEPSELSLSPTPETESDNIDYSFDKPCGSSLNSPTWQTSFADLEGHCFLNEAGRLVQLEMEKNFVIEEKNRIIQDTEELVDNLKSNIVHLQMEYTKLDQAHQKEISHREEVEKRMECTRSLIETTMHNYNILTTSIKQLESDKFRLVEFYNEIYKRQDETEEKWKNINSIVKEQDDLIMKGVVEVREEKDKVLEELQILTSNLSLAEEKLKCEMDQKIELGKQLGECRDEIYNVQSTLVAEQQERMKSQTTESKLRNEIDKMKTEGTRKLKFRKVVYEKRIKSLKSKLSALNQDIFDFQEKTSKYLALNKDLEKKNADIQNELEKVSENNAKEVNKLKEELNLLLCENQKLNSDLDQLKKNIDSHIVENKEISEKLENLGRAYDMVNYRSKEMEFNLENVLKDNSFMKNNIDDLKSEIDHKNKMNEHLKLLSQNADKFSQKIDDLELKLLKYQESEAELNKYIALLNNTLSKERCDHETLVSEQQAYIKRLENSEQELKARIESITDELSEFKEKYMEMNNEYFIKSAEIEKLENELKLMANEKEDMTGELKNSLEKEKFDNLELKRRIQELEEEKRKLENAAAEILDRNKYMQSVVEENREKIEKLHQVIEEKENLLKFQGIKVNQAEEQTSELKELLEKLSSTEEKSASLEKSLQTAEASMETYKQVIQKLEEEIIQRKNSEEEAVKNLKWEISSLKLQIQNKTDQRKSVTRKRNNKELSTDDIANKAVSSNRTPSRTLLSTPKRLLNSPVSSPRFKISRPGQKEDPYSIDSDASSEGLCSERVLKVFKGEQKNPPLPRRFKK